jgi:hypothetical protein
MNERGKMHEPKRVSSSITSFILQLGIVRRSLKGVVGGAKSVIKCTMN